MTTERDRQRVTVTVRDSGEEIAAEFIPYVFERFRQGEFPSTFVADDQDHRPAPRCLRQSDPGWNAPLIRGPDGLLSACATTPIPPAQFCGG